MTNLLNLREQFQALDQKIRGKPLVYLDTAATALKPRAVVNRMNDFYKNEVSSVHRGAHYLSDQATLRYEETRNKVAKFINAKDSREIIFTSGTTDGINLVAQAYGRKFFKKGDEIVLTQMEHHSNIVPWQMLAEELDLAIKWITVTDKGELDINSAEQLIGSHTRLVALTHCSNVLGTVNPVKQIVGLAKKVGARVLVDAAQSATFLSIDIEDLGCDFLTFSGHKIYGPFGVGILFGRYDLLEQMSPYRGGGAMISRVSESKTTFLSAPHKFEAGTPNISGVIGLSSAIDFVEQVGLSNIQKHDAELLHRLAQGLKGKQLSSVGPRGLKFIGESESRSSILSFIVEGVHASDIGQLLDQQGIAVRVGHHCAQPLMDRFAIPGTVRVSFGVYNSVEDVDIFISALHKALEILR